MVWTKPPDSKIPEEARKNNRTSDSVIMRVQEQTKGGGAKQGTRIYNVYIAYRDSDPLHARTFTFRTLHLTLDLDVSVQVASTGSRSIALLRPHGSGSRRCLLPTHSLTLSLTLPTWAACLEGGSHEGGVMPLGNCGMGRRDRGGKARGASRR